MSRLKTLERLDFPYSKELREIKNIQSLPSFHIDNQNQSFYSILKTIRTDIISKKLKNGEYYLFDRFINDLLGVETINVSSFYPPENVKKLESFLNELKRFKVDEDSLDCIIYYILKDFSSEEAELFIRSGDVLKISSNQYEFINTIYYLDRFNIKECLKYSFDNNIIGLSSIFINSMVRMANIISYYSSDEEDVMKLNGNIGDIRRYLELETSRNSSFSVFSIVERQKFNIFNFDLDILLIYLDSVIDTSPLEALNIAYKFKISLETKISYKLLLKVILIKVLDKTIRQLKIMNKLYKLKIIDDFKYEQLYSSMNHFILLNNQFIGEDIIATLSAIYKDEEKNQEEASFKKEFPRYYQKLIEHKAEVVQLAKGMLNQ